MNTKPLSKNDGIKNEQLIINSINNKKVEEISPGPQSFINEVYPNVSSDTIFTSGCAPYGMKPDIFIKESNTNNACFVSIKKGSNNSIHQEKIDFLLNYCIEELNMTEKESDSLLLYLYGDGTTDGNTTPDKWLNETEVRSKFSAEIEIFQNFLNKNKRALIERFLVYGKTGKIRNIKADYIYHGTTESGTWSKLSDSTIDYLVSLDNNRAPSIGPLEIKSWGRGNARNRTSLQVMWNTCKEDLNTIHALNLEDISPKETSRIIGNNTHGFINQDNFSEAINGKRFKDLSLPLRCIIKEMFPTIAESEFLHAQKKREGYRGYKNRIEITVNEEVKSLSIHENSDGISAHQEKLNDFLNYCCTSLDMTSAEEKAYRFLHYGDGTLDGSGSIEDRKENKYLILHHNDLISLVQNFIDRHKKELLERVLVYGKNGKRDNVKVDYIYIGTTANGIFASYDNLINSIIENGTSSSNYLHLCSFTLQTYRRNLSGAPKQEKNRHDIQFKVGSLENEINKLTNLLKQSYGTLEGDREEYALVRSLNSNKKSRHWKILKESLHLDNIDNIFAVKVLSMVPSSISQRKVKPKADIYLIRANFSQQELLNCNYWIDEDIISDLNYSVIESSGISCKRPDSKNFTYMKFTINTFNKIFEDPILGSSISLFSRDLKDVKLNLKILEYWNVQSSDFINYFNPIVGNFTKDDIISNCDICTQIKSYSNKNLTEIILSNASIRQYIFKGYGAFAEPYTANFTYINNSLELTDESPKFTVTTGSGRHQGKITIIISP